MDGLLHWVRRYGPAVIVLALLLTVAAIIYRRMRPPIYYNPIAEYPRHNRWHWRVYYATTHWCWQRWRQVLRFAVEDRSFSLVFALVVLGLIPFGYRHDHEQRWVILVGGAAAFATAWAAHENAQSRRTQIYPRITVQWREGASESWIVLRNHGMGTAFLRNLRVEARYYREKPVRGFSVHPEIAIAPGNAVHLKFGTADLEGRIVRAFFRLRVRATLWNLYEKRLLAIDERFSDPEHFNDDWGEDMGIWYHESRQGSFVP